jgi:hypothetical protein
MVVLGTVRARRSKERAYYRSGLMAGLMLLAIASILLSHFVLFAVFFVVAFVVSLVDISKVKEAFLREPVTQRQETNVSEPLKVRDLRKWKGWFKLAAQWGVHKATSVYVLVMTGISGGILFMLSVFGFLNPILTTIYTIVVVIASVILFRRQVEKNL